MIDVNERWLIDVDKYNYMPIQKSSKRVEVKDGKENIRYDREAYLPSLESAIKWICERECKETLSEASAPLSQALADIRDIHERFADILTKAISQ